jgi:hypothetical protein
MADYKLPTQAEIDALGVNSVGTCGLCGYHGPGPKHPCPKAADKELPCSDRSSQ